MISIFTCPKAFEGHFAVIQENAIRSWLEFGKQVEIILVGNEKGVTEFANKYRLKHVPYVERNSFGTPLVNSIFAEGEEAASYPIVAYVNADIILLEDFFYAVSKCLSLRKFLLVGQRTDIDINDKINFTDKKCYSEFWDMVKAKGTLRGIAAIDYFVYWKGLWKDILPFAMGRFCWDNWFLYRALNLGARLIDVTHCVTAIHQNHKYDNDNTKLSTERGEEIALNKNLAVDKIYDLLDSTHYLNSDGQIMAFRDAEHVWRRAWRMRERRPQLWKLLVSWKIRFAACWLFPSL